MTTPTFTKQSPATRLLTTSAQPAYVEKYSPWNDWAKNACWVAALMQLKDTANILLMLTDGTLLFGIFFGIGLPGLVLYVVRWQQMRRRVGRGSILVVAVLSLAHEVFWACIFQSDTASQEPIEHASVLAMLYWLGAGLNAMQLLALTLFKPEEEFEEVVVAKEENPYE